MSLQGILGAALGVLLIALLGRGVLAWLPPGEPGRHRTSGLAATCAASYLLGLAALAVAAAVAGGLGLSFSCAWVLAAGAAAGVARLATLPGALVPRHAVLHERAGPRDTALFALALAAGVLACAQAEVSTAEGRWSPRSQALLSQGTVAGLDDANVAGALATPPLVATAVAFVAWPTGVVSSAAARAHALACFLAALVLVESALSGARRAPRGRRVVLLLFALALAPAATVEDGDLTAAAFVALAVAGTVAWTRRADARGLALACLGAAALPAVQASGWVVATALLAGLLVATARASRLRAARWVLACAVLPMLAWPAAAWLRGVPWLRDETSESAGALGALASRWALGEGRTLTLWLAPVWIAAGAALGPAVLALASRASPAAGGPEADRTRRDLGALVATLGVLLALVLVALAASSADAALLARAWSPGLLVQAAPVAAVLAARALVRAERAA